MAGGRMSPCDGIIMSTQPSSGAHTFPDMPTSSLSPSSQGRAHLWQKGPPGQVPLGRSNHQVVASPWLGCTCEHLRQAGLGQLAV